MKKKGKTFKRSSKDKLLSGVLGGLSDYFEIDSTILRIFWLLLLSITGFIPGIIIYVILTILIPSSDKRSSKIYKLKQKILKHAK